MQIREANDADFAQVWPFFQAIVAAGDTYAYPRDIDQAKAHHLWMEAPRKTFVAEDNGDVLGSYYIKTNFLGPGSHVCNCGYMVSAKARGRGLATAMCQHSLEVARQLGYKAMQYNSVVATNEGAIRLWQKLGFEIVGRVPRAFLHPEQGYVDTLVMYQWLGGE